MAALPATTTFVALVVADRVDQPPDAIMHVVEDALTVERPLSLLFGINGRRVSALYYKEHGDRGEYDPRVARDAKNCQSCVVEVLGKWMVDNLGNEEEQDLNR